MIEIKIPKEIRKYKEKVVGGLTLRQLIAVIITGSIVIPLYIFLKNIIGHQPTSYIVMFISIPFLLLGFYEKDGLKFEKYIVYFMKFYFLVPQKRKYLVEPIREEED